MRKQSIFMIALVWIFAVAAAAAQAPSTLPSTGSATIFGTGGLTAGMHGTGPLLGGSVTYDLNDWLAVEGSGAYFNRGAGADGVSANASVLVNVVPSSRKAVPYFAIGGGVYRSALFR